MAAAGEASAALPSEMEEKRLAMQERMRGAAAQAEQRRAAKLDAAGDSGSADLARFEDTFGKQHGAAQAATEAAAALSAGAAADAALSAISAQLESLHALVADAASFLPLATREASLGKLGELESLLKAQRERLAPRKKFAFKNRKKVAEATAAAGDSATAAAAAAPAAIEAAAEAAAARGAAAKATLQREEVVGGGEGGGGGGPEGVVTRTDTFAAPAGCRGFRDAADATLIDSGGDGGGGGDFALENLSRCEVRLLPPTPISALWIRNLSDVTVFALPVKGSIYVTACERCTLYLGSRQLRMHTSTSVDFYVHASSHPIIEHCDKLRFAPYPSALLPPPLAPSFARAGLDPSNNQWESVDDFDWLKAQQSPHWSVLPDAERKPPPFLAADGEGAAAEAPVEAS